MTAPLPLCPSISNAPQEPRDDRQQRALGLKVVDGQQTIGRMAQLGSFNDGAGNARRSLDQLRRAS
jgi:hypothetical protein